MRKLSTFIVSGIFVLGSVSAVLAGKYDSLSVPQLLDELAFQTEMINETEDILLANSEIADRNGQELARLTQESDYLTSKENNYGGRVDQHNSEVNNYNGQCTTYELSESAYNSCNNWKSSLDSLTYQFDQEKAGLDQEIDDYNRWSEDFNQREENRAWAAQQLIRKYEEYEANINEIVNQLDYLASLQDFDQSNRDCASLPSLEEMHECMQNIWDGADY